MDKALKEIKNHMFVSLSNKALDFYILSTEAAKINCNAGGAVDQFKSGALLKNVYNYDIQFYSSDC